MPASVTVPCACCKPCEFSLNNAGGDEGFEETYNLKASKKPVKFVIVFSAYNVADRLQIFVDGAALYDSGCIGEEVGQPSSVTASLVVPENSKTIQFKVTPLCGPTSSGTAWAFTGEGLCIDAPVNSND